MLDANFNQIIEMIEKRKNNAYRKVNEEMILLYLEVGKFLYELKENSNYEVNTIKLSILFSLTKESFNCIIWISIYKNCTS